MLQKKIRLKSPDDIRKIREAGKTCAEVFNIIASLSLVGMSTWELDSLVDAAIHRSGGRSAFKTMEGYNFASCISLNDEVAHGIPSRKRYMAVGDLVKVDIGVARHGYFADTCRTFIAGVSGAVRSRDNDLKNRLVSTVEQAFAESLKVIRPGGSIEDIGTIIEDTVEGSGFFVIHTLTGHGVGFALHEPPKVPHYRKSGQRIPLQAGMVLAIEPAVTSGGGGVQVAENGFTIRTIDGAPAVQYEETIAVTETGPLLLTSI